MDEGYQELKEKGPKVTLNFFFSAHGSARDLQRFQEVYDKADVFVPELLGWNQKTNELYNDISAGTKDPAAVLVNVNFPEFVTHLLRIIHNKKKPIIFADAPQGSDLHEHSLELAPALQLFIQGKLQEAIDYMRGHVEMFAKDEVQREKHMVDSLTQQLRGKLNSIPELKDKKEINVLVQLGYAHATVYHALKEEPDFDVKRTLGAKTLVLDSFNQLIQKIKLGTPQEAIIDEPFARSLVEILIADSLKDLVLDGSELTWAAGKLAAPLSLNDVIGLSRAFAKNQTLLKTMDTINSFLRLELAKKGVIIPRTEEGIRKFLQKMGNSPIILGDGSDQSKDQAPKSV